MRQWYNFKTQRLRCPLSHKEILRSNLINDIAISLHRVVPFLHYNTSQCPFLLAPTRTMRPDFFNSPKRRLMVASDTPISSP